MALTFDEQFYLSSNADVLAAVNAGTLTDALTHFIVFGQKEGRDPNAFFDTSFYLANNADVQSALDTLPGFNVLDHYNIFGTTSAEGRDPNANFDVSFYLAQNPDVKAAVDAGLTDALTHWNEFGRFEDRAATDTSGNPIAAGTEITIVTDVVAAEPPPTPPTTPPATGTTFTLTTDLDAIIGTDQGDTIIGNAATTSQGDTIDGKGGNDTLTISGEADIPQLASVENLIIDSFDGDVSTADRIGIVNLTIQNEAALTDQRSVTLANGEALTLKNLEFATTEDELLISTTKSNETIILNDVGVTADGDDFTLDFSASATDVTTLTLQGTGSASEVEIDDDDNKLVTVNLTGNQNLEVSIDDLTSVTTVDATGMSAGATINYGAATAVTITGSSSDDTITGGAGADTIDGGAGNDTITGGDGGDTIDGGAGNDNFVYVATADLFSGTALVDDITGGAGTADAIVINNNGGATFTIAAADSWGARIATVETIKASGATNQIITITLNDDAFEAGITTVDLSADTDATAANVINVSAETGANGFTLTGSTGVDTITGGAGADTIVGGAGVDTITGGRGVDSITTDAGDDVVRFAGGTAAQLATDTVSDFTVGANEDLFEFDSSDLGLDGTDNFQTGTAGIVADGDMLVITDGFASLAAVATAIAANINITSTNGIFVYFDTTVGNARVVNTTDLAGNGTESVLAELTNITVVGTMTSFVAGNFDFIA